MSTALLVPIQLDALFVRRPVSSIGPTADYSVLPWVSRDTEHDRNPDCAFVAEEAYSDPFDADGELEAGVHLHWALPSALTRAVHPGGDRERVAFPRVPNRWLVIRNVKNLWRAERRWLVESDALISADAPVPPGTVTAMLPSSKWPGEGPRFRYLGRVREVSPEGELNLGESAVGSDRETWEGATGLPLTAVGPWDDPTFAALYPNCRNVFGLHDGTVKSFPAGASYEVVGWYSDPTLDVLAAEQGLVSGQDGVAAIHEAFGWTVYPDPSGGTPERLLCYGRLTFADRPDAEVPPVERARVQIAVGTTPVEALVAQLAHDLEPDPAEAEVLEQRLQSVRMTRQLEGLQLDLGTRVEQALHQEGFRPHPGGIEWRVVRRPSSSGSGIGVSKEDAGTELTLPEDAAHQLNELNMAQSKLDGALRNREWVAEQLYCDWYRAMLATYLRPEVLGERPELDAAADWLTAQTSANESDPSSLPGLDAQIAELASDRDSKREELQTTIDEHNTKLPDNQQWILRTAPGDRFWSPLDPAIVLSSPEVRLTDRHGAVGELSCRRIEWSSTPTLDELVEEAVSSGRAFLEDGDRGARSEEGGQPHHPLLLDWRAELAPLGGDGHPTLASGAYDPGWLEGAHTLSGVDHEPERRDGPAIEPPAAPTFEGRCILTPSAPIALGAHLDDWLGHWLKRSLADWRAGSQAPRLAVDRGSLETWMTRVAGKSRVPGQAEIKALSAADRASFLDWLIDATGARPVAADLLAASQHLAGETVYLGQQLGGFHRALLGFRDGLPLEIDDPLAFLEPGGITARVRGLLGADPPRTAPTPFEQFLPIRSGDLRILALRLIDSFGRVTDLAWDGVARPAALAAPQEDRVELRPRFCQPARLGVSWLSADHADVESNDHPATTPVCGWLVTNHVDGGILVFDGDGEALGSIEPPGRWRMPPGGGGRLRPDDIENPGLRGMVRWIVESARAEGFLDDLTELIEEALDGIDPEDVGSHPQALLVGRPLAVVRARLALELAHPAAVDQGWHAFEATIAGHGRDTRGFDAVRVPVRIGEHGLMNDGVVGFLVESAGGGFAGDRLYAPQGVSAEGAAVGQPRLVEWQEGHPALNLPLAAGDSLNLTLLLDPRGRLHASCGLLPTRVVSIPPEQYREALHRLEVWIRAAPVLSGGRDLELELPAEPGHRWSWAARTPDAWERLEAGGRLYKSDLEGALKRDAALPDRVWALAGSPDSRTVWQALIDAGRLELDRHDPEVGRWIEPGPSETAAYGELESSKETLRPLIARLLRDRFTNFAWRPQESPTVAREGWLLLSYDGPAAAEEPEDALPT